jgi:hypothetical protein
MTSWKLMLQFYKETLSDIFLIVFVGWTLLEFILMWLSSDNTVYIGETNLVILSIETGFCVFAVIWAIKRIRRYIRTLKKD